MQEKAEQKAKEAKKKAEAAIAKRVAEEMGMGSVGQANGPMLTAQRIKRKVVGGQVSVFARVHERVKKWRGILCNIFLRRMDERSFNP